MLLKHLYANSVQLALELKLKLSQHEPTKSGIFLTLVTSQKAHKWSSNIPFYYLYVIRIVAQSKVIKELETKLETMREDKKRYERSHSSAIQRLSRYYERRVRK